MNREVHTVLATVRILNSIIWSNTRNRFVQVNIIIFYLLQSVARAAQGPKSDFGGISHVERGGTRYEPEPIPSCCDLSLLLVRHRHVPAWNVGD